MMIVDGYVVYDVHILMIWRENTYLEFIVDNINEWFSRNNRDTRTYTA